MIPYDYRLLARASRRHLLRHPWRLSLAIAGIAVGVAVVVAVDVATTAAGRSFEHSMQAVSGRATHRITGGPHGGLDETLYRRLRLRLGVRNSAPLVEGYVEIRGEALRLLGVDPFAEKPFRDYSAGDTQVPVARLITEPGTVLLGRHTAERLRLRAGERFMLNSGGHWRRARLLGYLHAGNQPSAALENLMVADISTAQALLARIGRLSGIDVRLPDGERGTRLRTRIEAWLPPGVSLERSQARSNAMTRMTHAFFTNLTAMSWLALLVGMLLIYSTMTLSVLQRRGLIATLRIMGVTRVQVFCVVLMEALILSLVAVLLALPAGALLGQGLVGLVTRTINDLYFTLNVYHLFITPMTLVKGAALGVATTLLAALGPMVEATGAEPRATQIRSGLEARVRHVTPLVTLLGATFMLLAGLLLMTGRSLWLGFAALFALAIGAACITPGAVMISARLAAAPLARVFGILGVLATRGVVAGLSRTGVAAAALAMALAATVGVAIMIESFRTTVTAWLDSSLQADIYITTPGHADELSEPSLLPGLVAKIRSTRGIAAVVAHRWTSIGSDANPTQLHVIESIPRSRRGFLFKAGVPANAWTEFDQDQAVLVSEPYAYRRQLRVGDVLRLFTDHGARSFKVAGVFYDYGSSSGVVVMRRDLYTRLWNDRGVSSLGVYLRPGVSLRHVSQRLRSASHNVHQAVLIRSDRSLRAQSLAIFDRTFSITEVLRLLALVVAAAGILSALLALQLERGRELAVLRLIGFTPRQIGMLIMGETGLLGLICGGLAAPLGIIMALVLIDVINQRSFGWSMQVTIGPEPILYALALAVTVALLAGVYPAWKQAAARPGEALRAE
ncbi:MAG TPA: FtsX-like permease family protein [Gammaproteobacteria bacterium]|nr:FtsX-like permease family protein [Gammaproteobacteria bacterium]